MKEDIKLEQNKEEEPKFCLDLLPLFQADIGNDGVSLKIMRLKVIQVLHLSETIFSVVSL